MLTELAMFDGELAGALEEDGRKGVCGVCACSWLDGVQHESVAACRSVPVLALLRNWSDIEGVCDLRQRRETHDAANIVSHL